MQYEIKSKWGDEGICVEADSLKSAVEKAVKMSRHILLNANLSGIDLSGVDLREAVLCGTDFSGSDLPGACLDSADLCDSDLRGTNLTGAGLRRVNLYCADLSGVIGLPSAPVVPNIDAAILKAIENGGTLAINTWHTCETTHCRAGWAIVLAGEEGKKLEAATSPYLAGRLIYEASRPGVPRPDFFASTEDALADLKESAKKYGAAAH